MSGKARDVSLFKRIRTPFGDGAPPEDPQPAPAAPAVGEVLRARREELGLDLESVGEALRIRPSYLAALEDGRAQDLPGPTYAAGFIRAYGQHLGFDGDRVLARYKAQSSEIVSRPELSFPLPLDARSLPGVPILLVGLILALCGYGTWYYLSTGERSRPEQVAAVPAELQRTLLAPTGKAEEPGVTTTDPAAAPAAPAAPRGAAAGGSSASSTLVAGPVASLPPATAPSPLAPASPPTAAAPATTATAPPSAAAVSPPEDNPPSATPVAATAGDATAAAKGIAIRALADCWIRVYSSDDQSAVFERVLKKGETYQVPRSGLLLRTGNAGALAITVDGKAAPAIGRVGTLRRNVELDPQALLAGTAVHG